MYFSWCVDLAESARFALIFKALLRKKAQNIHWYGFLAKQLNSFASFTQDIMLKYRFYSQKRVEVKFDLK